MPASETTRDDAPAPVVYIHRTAEEIAALLRERLPAVEAAARAYTQKRHSFECHVYSGGRCDCF